MCFLLPMPVDADVNLVENVVRTTSYIGAVTYIRSEVYGDECNGG